MVDKIVELLQNLQKDIGELRGDVQKLSAKVDHLSDKSREEISDATNDVMATASQNTQSMDYGRDLSQSEQVYLNKLHVNESAEFNQGVVDNNIANNAPVAPAVSKSINIPQQDSFVEQFFIWLAKDWPMKVGGFFVIAAVGWFVTYAAAVGWLSPVARVVLGYGFAVICIAYGSVRADRERAQGNTFLIIGIAAMLISTLAGLYFDIIPYIVGLFVMLVSVGFVTLVSLKQKSIALTASMIFFGAIIPLFFFSGISVMTIFVYLFILTLGTLWIVSFTGWRGLTTFMLLVVGFYSIVYIATEFNGSVESFSNIVVAFLFAAVFYIANVSSIIKSEKTSVYDMMTAFGIGILMLVWILTFASEEFEVILILISVLFFASGSYAIFTKTGQKAPTAIYGGVTATLFAVATALQFDGPVLITAYLVEASAVVILVLYFARQVVTANMRILLTIIYGVPVIMSLGGVVKIFDYLSYPHRESVLNYMPELFTVFVVCVTAFSIAVSVLRLVNIEEKENMIFFRIFAYVGGAFSLILIWLVTHMFMGNGDIATFLSLVTYTIVGVVFYVMGVKEKYKPYMVVGGILFGIVVVRVLFVEFWDMDIVMRIITSFVLGALLISTAFIKKSK